VKISNKRTCETAVSIFIMNNLKIEQTDSGVIFHVKVVPGSSITKIAGILDGMLKVKIAAAPEKGKANQALIEFLSKKLGVKKNNIAIVSGQISPVKTVSIGSISIENILSALEPD